MALRCGRCGVATTDTTDSVNWQKDANHEHDYLCDSCLSEAHGSSER